MRGPFLNGRDSCARDVMVKSERRLTGGVSGAEAIKLINYFLSNSLEYINKYENVSTTYGEVRDETLAFK